MAVLTMFYGVIISMYYYDNRQHHFPHVHVRCQDMEAVVNRGGPLHELFVRETRKVDGKNHW